MIRRFLGLSIVLVCATTAFAQGPTSRVIRIIVPYDAGNAIDQLARVFASQLPEYLDEPVIVVNRGGANGLIGSAEGFKSPPDGRTIVFISHASVAINAALTKSMPFDPVKGFAPIVRTFRTSGLLVVRPDFPANNMKEFVEYARAQSNPIAAGYGAAASQLGLAKLRAAAGIKTVDVPYKAVNLAVAAVMGGHLAFTFADLTVALPLINSGKLKALGLIARERWSSAPSFEPIVESLPKFEMEAGWHGYAAPLGTPREAINKIYNAVARVIVKQENQARWNNMHIMASVLGPDEFASFIAGSVEAWKADARLAGVTPE